MKKSRSENSSGRVLSFQEAKLKIESYCVYQERCQFEVKNKLKTYGLYYSEIDQLVSHLISQNFVNEERFAEAFVSGKIRIKKWGRNKVIQQLKGKFISDYSIKKAFEKVDQEEYQGNLQHLAERKLESLTDKKSYQSKLKIARYLASKGFGSEEIFGVLNVLMGE